MDALILDVMENRSDFEIYKSHICHLVHDMGDMDFIITILENSQIRKLYKRCWYPESLYLLAMVDYLSRENDLPLAREYSDIRASRLKEPLYPAGILIMCATLKDDSLKAASWNNAIPEFRRFNIVESEVRDVC